MVASGCDATAPGPGRLDKASTDPTADPFYINVRTSNHPRAMQVREHCERMWAIYHRYADRQFLAEFPRRFHDRWFEMYLTVTLLQQGAQVQKTRPPGPDVLVADEGRRIWVERYAHRAESLADQIQ